jgi:peptidoglycan hydrolase-like protein with peptidoglycan-binding domain
MKRRVPLALLAAVAFGAVLASTGLWAVARRTPGGADAAAGPAAQTVTVLRTDVAARDMEAGTIGYAGDWHLANPGPGGVLTAVPAPGTVVSRGQPLYEVDGRPARFLYGDRPVWRDLTLGMGDGPDVRQLETNLVALGYGAGVTVDDHFSAATAAAISRWQATLGVTRTGALGLGDVLFAPGPTRVSQTLATPGTRIGPGQDVIEATSTARVVTVNLPTVQQAVVSVGVKVAVTPPTGGPQPGTVTTVGRVAQTTQPGSPGGPQQATITVTITLDNPDAVAGLDQAPVQVAIITSQHEGVLAVPVTALIAAAGGGYQVVVDEAGTRRRITVQPGIFDEITNLIEVSGTALAPGQQVEVPAP